MLHFEGERAFPLSPAELWSKLRDARFLAASVPDAMIHPGGEPDKASCSVRPNLSFVGGTLDTTIEIVDAKEPTDLRYRILSKGVGSSAEVETTLHITAEGSGARIHWGADVKSLGGLLKVVPQGLVRGAAQKTIENVWEGIGDKLTA